MGNQKDGRVDAVWADRSFAFVHIFDCQRTRSCGSRVFRLDGPGVEPVEVAPPPTDSHAFRPLPGGGALIEWGSEIFRLRATEKGEWTSELIAPMPERAYAAAVDVAGASIRAILSQDVDGDGQANSIIAESDVESLDLDNDTLPNWEEHPILGLDLEEHCYDLQFDEFAACDQGGACRLSVVSELDWGNPGENYDAQ